MSLVVGTIGPMFSGKTSWLLRKLNYYSDAGMSVLYINSDRDERTIQVVENQILESRKFSTHSSNTHLDTNVHAIKVRRLCDVGVETIREYDVIGIDELQFFEDAHVIIDWKCDHVHARILYASLDSDYMQRPFANIFPVLCGSKYKKRVALCDTPEHKAIAREAPYTVRIVDSTELFQAGGKKEYRAMCFECLTLRNKAPSNVTLSC